MFSTGDKVTLYMMIGVIMRASGMSLADVVMVAITCGIAGVLVDLVIRMREEIEKETLIE